MQGVSLLAALETGKVKMSDRVNAVSYTHLVSFTWEITNSSTVTVNLNGEESTLELSNGLLIENSALGLSSMIISNFMVEWNVRTTR